MTGMSHCTWLLKTIFKIHSGILTDLYILHFFSWRKQKVV
ncbi:rCG24528, isoform CRA_b, partial [Rattus norvegicus]